MESRQGDCTWRDVRSTDQLPLDAAWIVSHEHQEGASTAGPPLLKQREGETQMHADKPGCTQMARSHSHWVERGANVGSAGICVHPFLSACICVSPCFTGRRTRGIGEVPQPAERAG
jgi:hypothetical protein